MLHKANIICSLHNSGQKRTPNYIGAITNIINPDNITDHSSIGPILADILCRLCSDIVDKKKRENCIKKFCAGTVKFSTSADISTFSTSSGITKLARSSGSSKLARSSGISKLARLSGVPKTSTSFGVSKFSKSARSSNLRSRVIINNLTDILCKLCNNLSDKTTERDCAVKYCQRSIGALPFIPQRNKHSLTKVRKPKV